MLDILLKASIMFPNLYYNWEVFHTRCYFHKLKTIKCLSINWSRRLNEEFLKQIIWRVAYAKRKPICSRLYTVRIVKLQSSITICVTYLEATWGWNMLLVDADHCVRSVRVQSYSGPHFPSFGLNTTANNAMKLL